MGIFLDAAEIVLKRYRQPMTARGLTEEARKLRLLDDINGKTPWHTMRARLSEDIKWYGTASRFMRTKEGVFALREFGSKEYRAKPFKKSIKTNENVLVFPINLLREVGWFHGIKRDFKKYSEILLDPKNTRFLQRVEAESNENYKQVINYVLVKYGNSMLRFVRGSYTSAQDMLKGQCCIGFGGHVESPDFFDMPLFSYFDSGYTSGMLRELSEELRIPPITINSDNLKMIGVLNDDSSYLGLLHFAFINLLDLTDSDLDLYSTNLKGEKSINQLKFIPFEELSKEFEKYEYWSKLCIKTFFKKTANIQCNIHCPRNFKLRQHSRHIAVVGSIGSGKTEVCNFLRRKFGYFIISTGRILAKLLDIPPTPKTTREEFCDLAEKFINSVGGPEKLADEIYHIMSLHSEKRFVIDGLRNVSTFDVLRRKLRKKLPLVYVDAMIDNAYDFFRRRESSNFSLQEFAELVHHPVEKAVEDFMDRANIVIYNHGSKTSYMRKICDFFVQELK